MKKFILGALALLMSLGANAQYQMANSGFEEWESVSSGNKKGEEPKKWSSFLDGTGKFMSLAAGNQLEKSTDIRPGSTGKYSAKLFASEITVVVVKVTAQGNFTNGCINMGSTTATDANGNYNYINTAREDQSMKFTGHPDAVKAWVKFKGAKTGNVEAVLVTSGYYQSPEVAKNTATKVAKAQNDKLPSNDKWTEYVIPFTYSSDKNPEYVLINMSTCSEPGKGAKTDYMFVDDLEMLYYSELKSATYNGAAVSFSGTSAAVDAEYDESKLTLTSNGRAATIEKSYNKETAVLTVTVKGEDIASNASNFHTYTIQFKKPIVNYTITYMVDGAAYQTYTIAEGSATTKPADPAKTGYTFAGWDPAVAANVTGNATYTAKWTPIVYTITFDVDGTKTTQQVAYGNALTLPANPTKTGYKFKGWSPAVATSVTADATYTATWEAEVYTITFDVDGTKTTQQVAYGNALTMPANPTKTGYTFKEWSPAVATTVETDATYTATWTINKYEIAFVVDGKETKSTLEYGQSISKPADPVKTGYTFTGWNPSVPEKVTAKGVYTAQFSINSYLVKFVADGKDVSSKKLDYASQIEVPSAPEKVGYTFIKWTPEVAQTVPASDVVYAAEYTVNKYNVTFKNGDDVVSEGAFDYGSTIAIPTAPEKEGYDFLRWEPAIAEGATVPASDVVYTAVFGKDAFEITYMIGEETIQTVKVEYGDAVTAIVAPDKEGYTFDGWQGLPQTMPAKNITVVGSYSINQYEVVFYGEDGEVISKQMLEYNSPITVPEVPQKEGYTFDGWNAEVASVVPAYNLEYTATYKVNSYTVKFVDEDGTVYQTATLPYGSPIEIPEVADKEGLEFAGWTPSVDATVPASDVVYTAEWRIPASVGGIASESGKVEYYTPSGIRLAAPRKGVNLVKIGGKVTKIYVK